MTVFRDKYQPKSLPTKCTSENVPPRLSYLLIALVIAAICIFATFAFSRHIDRDASAYLLEHNTNLQPTLGAQLNG